MGHTFTNLVCEHEGAGLHEEVTARLFDERHRQPRRGRRVATDKNAARGQGSTARQHLRLAQTGVADDQDLSSIKCLILTYVDSNVSKVIFEMLTCASHLTETVDFSEMHLLLPERRKYLRDYGDPQFDIRALTSKKSQEETRLDHLVPVDSRAQGVNQKLENLALKGVNFVYHVEVGPRKLDAQVRSDRSLRCCAAAALFLVSVVRHGKCVEVEDESAIAAFSTTKIRQR